MLVAYVVADREALFSLFSNPDKFTGAAPYTFLIASIILLIFGPGKISLDAFLAGRMPGIHLELSTGSLVAVQR